MKQLFIILLMLILADRVAPENKDNSALLPLTTFTESNERNIVMSQLKEIWRNIKGYKGLYEVSNLGRVKRVEGKVRFMKRGKPHTMKVPETTLKPGIGAGRYAIVSLTKEGMATTHYVHRLVWDAFGNHPSNGYYVDHINEIPTDNRITNLQLLTPSENTSKSHQHKGRELPPCVYYRSDGKRIKRYSVNVTINGKVIRGGDYKTVEEAVDAYKSIQKKHLFATGAVR